MEVNITVNGFLSKWEKVYGVAAAAKLWANDNLFSFYFLYSTS